MSAFSAGKGRISRPFCNLEVIVETIVKPAGFPAFRPLHGHDPQMPVNFLTDNDITGGNSGSPVLDSRGRLIGLAFDGNKESLASDLSYTPGYNKCVCVDIRYVLWTLDHYAGMSRIIDELGL